MSAEGRSKSYAQSQHNFYVFSSSGSHYQSCKIITLNEMEAFLAFDPQNHPFVIEYNNRFLDVIARIALKHGILPCSSKESARRLLARSEDSELLTNIIVLVFAPCVASLRIIGEEESSSNLLSQMVPNARFRYVDYLDHVILHVSEAITPARAPSRPDRTVASERSLDYFVELMKFAFGSNPTSARWDECQRNLLVSLHRWWLSSNSCPSYLLEVNTLLSHHPTHFDL